MKNSLRMILVVLCATFALVFAAATARAQDPVKVAPNNFKVLLENNRVRVLEFHSKAGEKIGTHSHPAHVTYIISGSGKTKFTSPDGKTTERENKAGEAIWNEAATHASEYQGTGEIHVLDIELKGRPAKKIADKK